MWVAFAKATHIFSAKIPVKNAKATHIFSAKIPVNKYRTVNILTTKELVKLTMLWTIGPSFIDS